MAASAPGLAVAPARRVASLNREASHGFREILRPAEGFHAVGANPGHPREATRRSRPSICSRCCSTTRRARCGADHQGRRQRPRRRWSGPRRRLPSCPRSRAAARRCIWRRRSPACSTRPSRCCDQGRRQLRHRRARAPGARHGQGGRVLAHPRRCGRDRDHAQRRHQRSAQGPHRRHGRRRAGL